MGCKYSDLLSGKCAIGSQACDENGFCVCDDDEDPIATCNDYIDN